LTEADSFDKLKDAVRGTMYEPMLLQVTDIPNREKASEFSSAGKSIDDVMFVEKSKKYSMAFEN
jgi:V-type H+-transporting ATPase subunit d